MKIVIKNKLGEVRTFSHEYLKLWRDGEMVEVYYHKPDRGDLKKVILWMGHQPTDVMVEEDQEKKAAAPRESDPFTKEALGETDTQEEKALLETYKAIEGKKKRKRRTKEEMAAARALEKKEVVNDDSGAIQ